VFQQGAPPDAVYTFKHALVQDAAYDSLLKARRTQLHGKMARVIEERWPHIEATEPELLAYHYTEARLPEKAIPLWQKAGSLALGRIAHAEAIAHLNKGLELIGSLPPSPVRDGKEVDLLALLGTAWQAFKGWQVPEVWDSVRPALDLANALRRNDALLPIFWGLWVNVFCLGRQAESLHWVEQISEAAEAYRDPDLRILEHYCAISTYLWLVGDPTKAREHTDQVLFLYNEEQHRHLVHLFYIDPKTAALCWGANAVWMLGYPDQAAKMNDAGIAHARQLAHPFDLGWALTNGRIVFDHLGEQEERLVWAAEGEQLGREHSLPMLTEVLVPLDSGTALIHKSETGEGVALLEKGLAFWQAGAGRIGTPYWRSVLAEGMAQLGNLDGAMHLIDEVIAEVETPDRAERYYCAETLRIKGGLLAQKGDPAAAESSYVASLDCARAQQAKSWELRTATSYARLMRDQGRLREAYDLLAPVYGWFTEGFATNDLKDARALLDELETSGARRPPDLVCSRD
jgi:predicted ATPase